MAPVGQGKESAFGTNAAVKIFYENHKKGWVETPPKQTSSKNAKVYDRVAIKVFKVPDPKQPIINVRSALKVKNLEIQSPVLVAALKDIFEPIGTFLELHETARLTEPFKPLYFAYDKIMDLYNRTYNDTVLKEHLHLLTELMGELFGTMMSRLRHLRESKLICYEYAWTYFPKGSIIYNCGKDCERLYRVVDTKYDENLNQMEITGQERAFDGTKFAWKTDSLRIPKFDDNIPIISLPSYPLAFHRSADLLKAKLITRGKLLLDYQELKYREYSGTGQTDDAEIKRHNVSTYSLCVLFLLRIILGIGKNTHRSSWI